MSSQIEKHAAPISHQLNTFLKRSGLPVKFFCHDMTFEKGRCAMLSSNIAIPIEYHNQRIPLVYTNAQGRTIKDGAYITQHFENEQREWFTKVKSLFEFSHVLSILRTEKNCQHFYSFTFTGCSDNYFVHHVINHLSDYHHFIDKHHITFRDIIDNECDEYVFDFPYDEISSDFELKKLTKASFIDLLTLQQQKCVDLLLQGYSFRQIASEMQLTYKTVEHYLAHIRAKFQCKTTRELILKLK